MPRRAVASRLPLLLLVFLTSLSLPSHTLGFSMTWNETWDDILNGGNSRWKVTDPAAKQAALTHIQSQHSDDSCSSLNILCPLAGDDSFVKYAWEQGHSVTAIDLVPSAVAAMRAQFGEDASHWTSSTSGPMVVWKHSSERATLYQGDVLHDLKELHGTVDAVYDKDSFGALDKELRKPLCERLHAYLRPGGTVYIEVKNKPEGPSRLQGPPYHVEKSDLLESFEGFDYVSSLGKVYEVAMPGMSQMGHILKRVANK